ncbi:TspO/MBR family protein [Paenibacillus sp. M1]|uniref:TspO/MBR family protein n=1 Tax=Paenibacillus haidiansis TaxID=1574488 RepID=A0ABU7VR17_9BACL
MFSKQACRWWNCLLFLALIAINIFAEAIPLGSGRTGELSERYLTLLTPAGYAFAIWIVIYILLGCAVVYLFRRKDADKPWGRMFTLWFALSCLFNAGWLALWHYESLIPSFAAIVLLLVSLAMIYRYSREILHPTRGETWFLRIPFSLYFGWVFTASLINLQVILQHSRLRVSLPQPETAIILLIIGAIAMMLVGNRTRDGLLPLPTAWGYIAVAVKHSDRHELMFAAWLAAAVLLIYSLALLFFRARERD